MTPGERGNARPIGTYALVALDVKIAGSVLRLTAGCSVVLCGCG
jgi:hypothetical protein